MRSDRHVLEHRECWGGIPDVIGVRDPRSTETALCASLNEAG